MGHYRIIEKSDLTSITPQDIKSLHETLEEYLTTGNLDAPSSESSYDFDSADEVDFDKPVPHDVDMYDAAARMDDPFLGVTPLNDSPTDANNTASSGETVIPE